MPFAVAGAKRIKRPRKRKNGGKTTLFGRDTENRNSRILLRIENTLSAKHTTLSAKHVCDVTVEPCMCIEHLKRNIARLTRLTQEEFMDAVVS